jgi:predicted DNA-binding protein (MmcQ/YjbR family)
MDLESLREYCLSKPGTEECFPFDEDTLVFKVAGKMFLLLSISSHPLQFNVKCDPELAIKLREKHACVSGGYHMNKKFWNTIIIDYSVPRSKLIEWIDHSYHEVIKKLPGKIRKQFLP